MALYDLAGSFPELVDPLIVAAFDGWVDAAGAASGAASVLAEGGELVARFDADELFDYRSRRPVLDVVDGELRELTWPELTLRRARVTGRDVLVFTGAEPDLRWARLARDVVELARTLGVAGWVSLGAVPAAVAHTRSVPVLATASRDGLLRDGEQRGPAGLLRVPAAALSALEMAATAAGIPAVGFFAQVPPYVGGGYAAASVALLERLERHLAVPVPFGRLVETARDERQRYDAAVAGDAETRDMVARLGGLGDEADDEEALPTGDDLAREIQRFLREQADEGDGQA